ncbi:MAG: hypothetical protein NT154_13455 [Verrucomicrobia bacterium]|nr:hypothetical protein [Verrucomicrobiota bacterium]
MAAMLLGGELPVNNQLFWLSGQLRARTNVAEDIHLNERADGGALGGVGHFARGAVIVVAQFLEVSADLVRHLEGVQRCCRR